MQIVSFFLDTSFMYVIAVLVMVKLYQNRHPDINATAYSTFSVVGIAIFIGMCDVYYFIFISLHFPLQILSFS